MPDFPQLETTPWLLPLLVAVPLVLAGLIYLFIRSRRNTLQRALNEISFERLEGLIIPNADEGVLVVVKVVFDSV